MWWLYIPLLIIGVVLAVFLLLVVLGRYKNGALLRPVIEKLSRVGFMRRFFTKVSTAAIERQNPELASALKKINTVAANPNPQAVQKAMSRLTPAERRAYMEAAQEQGAVPESANRQMRRQAERMQQQTRGGRPGGGSSSSRKRKRK
jgi:biopolymer transport protein ExbB/TolQ